MTHPHPQSHNRELMIAQVVSVIHRHNRRTSWADSYLLAEDIVNHITNIDFSVWLIAAIIEGEQSIES